MNNLDVRLAVKENGLRLWQIAEKLNMTDGNFSRMLRKELTADQKARIFSIIAELSRD